MKKQIIFAVSILLSCNATFSMQSDRAVAAVATTTAVLIAAGIQLQPSTSAQLSNSQGLPPAKQQQALEHELSKGAQKNNKPKNQHNQPIQQPQNRGRK